MSNMSLIIGVVFRCISTTSDLPASGEDLLSHVSTIPIEGQIVMPAFINLEYLLRAMAMSRDFLSPLTLNGEHRLAVTCLNLCMSVIDFPYEIERPSIQCLYGGLSSPILNLDNTSWISLYV